MTRGRCSCPINGVVSTCVVHGDAKHREPAVPMLTLGRRYQLGTKVLIYLGFKDKLQTFRWEGAQIPGQEGISDEFCTELLASGLLTSLDEQE